MTSVSRSASLANGSGPPVRARRRWRRVAATVLGAVLVFTVAGWPLYVDPAVDTVSPNDPADAILALGGEAQTAFYAERLFRAGDAGTLVLSAPRWAGPVERPLRSLCSPPADARIICFDPDPGTTQGEAEEIRKLSVQNHWDDVVVVAPTFHVSRARFLVKRCYDGRLRMVPYRGHTRQWPQQYLYQTLAFAKAFILVRDC